MSENYLHVQLISASAAHKKRSRQQFQELNLTEGQPKVLSILLGMEGCQQKELAGACHVEPATMTVLLKNMEQGNLIAKERVALPGGKRAYRIYLTEHGRACAESVCKIVEDLEQVAFRNFSEQEKQLFLELFGRVAENLQE